jgi:hypothetical protein
MVSWQNGKMTKCPGISNSQVKILRIYAFIVKIKVKILLIDAYICVNSAKKFYKIGPGGFKPTHASLFAEPSDYFLPKSQTSSLGFCHKTFTAVIVAAS